MSVLLIGPKADRWRAEVLPEELEPHVAEGIHGDVFIFEGEKYVLKTCEKVLQRIFKDVKSWQNEELDYIEDELVRLKTEVATAAAEEDAAKVLKHTLIAYSLYYTIQSIR